MPSYRELYPEKWLRSDHLGGKSIEATIVEVHLEEVYNTLTNKKERRLAASFASSAKLMTINKTNAEALEKLTGTDDYDRWRNVRVTLQPGRAPNGKGTIFIKPAAAPAPVHGRQEQVPVHGRTPEPQVHGRTEAAPVHGLAGPQIFDLDEVDEVPWETGEIEEEDESTIVDPKSVGHRPRPGTAHGDVADESVQAFVDQVRSLNQESAEPMSAQQHEFVINLLSKFTGKPGEQARQLLSDLVGREVNLNNPAGVKIGRYLYDVTRDDTGLPGERAALARFCQVEKV